MKGLKQKYKFDWSTVKFIAGAITSQTRTSVILKAIDKKTSTLYVYIYLHPSMWEKDSESVCYVYPKGSDGYTRPLMDERGCYVDCSDDDKLLESLEWSIEDLDDLESWLEDAVKYYQRALDLINSKKENK